MKKLFLLSFLFLFFLSSAQQLEGVDPEHLVGYSSLVNRADQFRVNRIRLSTGVELEYTEQGIRGNTAVVFLHGITDSRISFEETFLHLPSYIHAFALSQRGHGASSKP